MKKQFCTAMSAALLLSTIPVCVEAKEFKEITDVYVAKVGTKDFTKNYELQPLDAEIYIKEDYVMLPLRTFMKAVDPDAEMVWDNKTKTATVELEGEEFIFDIMKNEMYYANKELRVYGKMEISQDRIFVPLRNWKSILENCEYTVGKNDLTWNEKAKIATIVATKEVKVEKEETHTDYSDIKNAPEFTLGLSNKYDSIKNAGNGLFIAEKYMDDNIGLGQGHISAENEYYLIDGTGKVYLEFESETIHRLQSLNDGLFLIRSLKNSEFDKVIDKEGNVLFEIPYDSIEPFYEGLAQVSSDGFTGFIDQKGNPVIELQFEYAENFSEGFAAVCVGVDLEEKTSKWNYINKNGDFISDKQYRNCESFSDGMGRIITEDGTGYIDQTGNVVIKPQYKWGSPFMNRVAYVQDKNTNEIWLINKSGEKIKMITKVNEDAYVSINENSHILVIEEIIDLPDGDHQHKQTYFDANGEVSKEKYRMRKETSEGFAPAYNEKTDKYGYSSNDYLKVSYLFDEVDPFKDGYAVVRNGIELKSGEEDVEWGIIKAPR